MTTELHPISDQYSLLETLETKYVLENLSAIRLPTRKCSAEENLHRIGRYRLLLSVCFEPICI